MAVEAMMTTRSYAPLLLAAASSFFRSYSVLLHSLAVLLTASTTKAASGTTGTSPQDRRPDGGCHHGLQEQDGQQTVALTGEEVEEVLRRMGLVGAGDGKMHFDDGPGEEVSRLFDADEPSLEEARRAFAVFDEDGDGFIGPADLRSALARLGFLQADVGACRRMIDAGCGAGRGGGRMSLPQFVRFLESGF